MAEDKLTGLSRLRQHFPALRTRSGTAGILLLTLGVIAATTAFFLIVDRYFAEWLPDGEIVVMSIGFLILSRFFSQKVRYFALFGQHAYARAFTAFAIPGLGILAASLAHLGYMPGPMIPDLWWKPVLVGIGWLLLLIGVLLWWRALNALGFDNLMLLYVYFPTERRVVSTGLYRVLRHPIYSAALHIATGLAFIHAGWYSLLTVLVLHVFFFGWIRLVEERELILQLPAYEDYRSHVPAFAPRLRDMRLFWRLLVAGDAGGAATGAAQ